MSESRPIEVGFRLPPTTPRPGPVVKTKTTKVSPDGARTRPDVLVAEEPCEIIVHHRGVDHTIAITMRTPGNDFELAVGFLFGEGVVGKREFVSKVSYCASGPPEQLYNQVTVELTQGAPFDPLVLTRNVTTSSSCGVCGKASLDHVRVHADDLDPGPFVDQEVIEHIPDLMRAEQRVFERTGGIHGAGLFSPDGSLVMIREDIGRHNAVDKVVGASLMAGGLPARERILHVSGRASFEIVQKAAVAGIPIVTAVSAPSSLAVDLAREMGMTLVGFARGETFNIYSGSDRIRLASSN